ncbi:SEL1-like repeat protein [Pseudoduganella armeniaca]|uniref:WG repeat-containing protein n=1 Tax=Pseudoduganella armeniaca TaxID=2072590 RepID=A0A2R4C7N8_9BURK|nr:SEL1-like repeat protein [Pseudoduganella armeniaca]AVR95647.1 hypothetical protein C9I28_07855 [Pseudoduganella armeniaca]
MGNRVFLYTVDKLPDGGPAPAIEAAVAEANNFLPPLWQVLFSAAMHGPSQEAQQVFLPSVCGGIYAERALAEQRLFQLLTFVAAHPGLPDPDDFAARVDELRAALAAADGTAYYGELNEYFWLAGTGSPEAMMDDFVRDCAARWERAQAAIEGDDHRAIEKLYHFTPHDAADELGFGCWLAEQDDGGDWNTDDEVCEGLYVFEQDELFGLRRADGTVVLPAGYDAIDPIEYDQPFGVLERQGKLGLYDRDGKEILAPCLDDLYDWREGYALFEQGGKFGYLDAQGRQAIAAQFLAGCSPFNLAGVASVETAQGHGLIDRTGKPLTAITYKKAEYLDDLAAWRLKHGPKRVDLFLADGTPWIAGPFKEVRCLVDGGDAVVRIDKSYGTFQRNGQPGLPANHSELELLCQLDDDGSGTVRAIYLVVPQGAQGVGATLYDGTVLVPPQFEAIDVLQELRPSGDANRDVPALFVVDARNGCKGLWDAHAQQLVLPCEYRFIWSLVAAGRALLLMYRDDEGWIVAHPDGTPFVPQRYERFAANMREPDLMAGVLAAGDIEQAWSAGKAAYAWRDGQAWRLYADGREVTEVAYQLEQARKAPPIAADAAAAARLGPHVIAGMGDALACAALGEASMAAGDATEACRWYATAAAAGQLEAQLIYARCLLDGTGCTADAQAARRQLEQALDEYPEYRDAANLLGQVYEGELGDACDPVRARALYAKAAGDHRYGSDEAQYHLGRCWRDGIGGPVDPNEALRLFELAAVATPGTRRGGHAAACEAAASLHRQLAQEAKKAGRGKAAQRHAKQAQYFSEMLRELGK